MKIILVIFLSIFSAMYLNAQDSKYIAITIDDVPNTKEFKKNNYKTPLLDSLIQLDIPYTIFVNEGLLHKTKTVAKNKQLLKKWCRGNQVIIANHTYAHSRYSTSGFDDFSQDIIKGETLIKKYLDKKGEQLTYFRFPYNDLGKDSVQQVRIDSFLRERAYISTPFTVESSDWMFNYVYKHYIEKGDENEADRIGELYVQKTIEMLQFHEKLALEQYGRAVKQIYLCHDNELNRQYLPRIIRQFQKKNYQIIDLDQTLEDSIYQQKNDYYKKWGITWFYRWMDTKKERRKWMYAEPSFKEIQSIYNELTKAKK